MARTLDGQRIAVTGASGMVGQALTGAFRALGATVVPVSRQRRPGGIQWDPEQGGIMPSTFEGMSAVIHLAGENIAARRWTAARKRRLTESRTGPTRLLAKTLAGLRERPAVLVSVSAVGIYGDRGDESLPESATTGHDFLAELAVQWEAAAEPAMTAGIRVVHPRFGVILSSAGGALPRMLPTARLGLGGPLGGGNQWMSWVAIDDVCGVLAHLLRQEDIAGPVNTVAPHPVRNRDFAGTLGAVLHRPARIPVPAFALTALYGELARATLLASQRVRCAVLERSGYQFEYPELGGALEHILRTQSPRRRS